MKRFLLALLNPVNWIRAFRFRRQQRAYDRSAFDLELYLYARILPGGMLHYGFFDDTDVPAASISLNDLEAAQRRYATLLTGLVPPSAGKVLDAGCGMGGLTALLLERGHRTEALTPNRDQARFVRENYPQARVHETKFEDLAANQDPFDVIIHSESLQYIPLQDAFHQMSSLLKPGGMWIVSDYFRLADNPEGGSGHLLQDFRTGIQRLGWTIEEERDITAHVLPTLRLVWLYAERFLLPLQHFGLEKFRFKAPFWYYLTAPLREQAQTKTTRELTSVDPERFHREKRYQIFVIRRPD